MESASYSGHNSVFAKRLRGIMEKQGVTQQALSKKIGTSRQAVSQYTDGSVQPNIEKLYKMSTFFNVSSDYLLGIDDCDTHELESLKKATGLSEEAVRILENWGEHPGIVNRELEALSFIIENAYSTKLLECLYNYIFVIYFFLHPDNNSILPERDEVRYYDVKARTFTQNSKGATIIDSIRLNDMHFAEIVSSIVRLKDIYINNLTPDNILVGENIDEETKQRIISRMKKKNDGRGGIMYVTKDGD